MIDDYVRDKLLKIYMQKCTNDYTIKFNKWRLKYIPSGEGSGVDTEDLQRRLEYSKKQ